MSGTFFVLTHRSLIAHSSLTHRLLIYSAAIVALQLHCDCNAIAWLLVAVQMQGNYAIGRYRAWFFIKGDIAVGVGHAAGL
ncbi:hypothetical protein BH11PSE12_BH11PSE12_09360 [soil metagenome]